MSTYKKLVEVLDLLEGSGVSVTDPTTHSALATIQARLDAPMDTNIGVRNGDIPGWGGGLSVGDVQCDQTERQLCFGLPSAQTHLGFDETRVGILLNLASTSTADDGSPLGTGMQKIAVSGIQVDGGGTFVRAFEIYTLDGQTEVEMGSNLWLCVEFMLGGNVGSGLFNAGDINIGPRSDTWTAGVPETVWGVIGAGNNISRFVNLGCASNEKCYPGIWTINTDTNANNAGVEFTFLIRGWSDPGGFLAFAGRTQRAFRAFVIGNLTKQSYGVGFPLDPGDVFQPSVVAATGTHEVGFFIDIYRKVT